MKIGNGKKHFIFVCSLACTNLQFSNMKKVEHTLTNVVFAYCEHYTNLHKIFYRQLNMGKLLMQATN